MITVTKDVLTAKGRGQNVSSLMGEQLTVKPFGPTQQQTTC